MSIRNTTQNAQNLQLVQRTSVVGKNANNGTSPPAPVVNRAWAFELAADGSNLVPLPQPGAPAVTPLSSSSARLKSAPASS